MTRQENTPDKDRFEEWANSIRSGNRRALARAITLVESTRVADIEDAQQLLEQLLPHSGGATRIGISGVPGAGKSTFIEALGLELIASGHKVAVLTIDPSSPRSGGSILGDKTRMPEFSRSDAAFVRPSPAGKTLGGVARKTRETMLVCEAAGYDVVLVETVGVGQAEWHVSSMVDFFAVLMLPNAGDSLQGIKRGILELADAILVNKADGDQQQAAAQAVEEYRQALQVSECNIREKLIRPCSAINESDVRSCWQQISEEIARSKQDGRFDKCRSAQLQHWIRSLAEDSVLQSMREVRHLESDLETLTGRVQSGETTPLRAGLAYRQKILSVLAGSSDRGEIPM